MPKVYFLDGLGSNAYYTLPLKEAFFKQGIELLYLALPGHPANRDYHIEDMTDLARWFEEQVDEDRVVVMGFSLGADLASILAMTSKKIERLILLDGAVTDFTAYPLDKELTAAKTHMSMMVLEDLEAYLAEQARQTEDWNSVLEQAERASFEKREDGNYYLALDEEIVLNLLSIRHQFGNVLTRVDFQTPTLVIISEQPKQLLTEKQSLLAKASKEYVSSLVLKGTSHQLYLEAPEKIVTATRFFLDAF